MRIMYDSVNANKIPTDAVVVAGYINGRFKWSDNDWKRLNNSEQVRIQVYIPHGTWTSDGDVLDVEASDAITPAAQEVAKRWVASRIQQGKVPCIYTSKSTQHFLQFPGCEYWLADYTHVPHLLPGTVATQYDNPGGFDLSVCADTWPHHTTVTQPISYKGRHYLFVNIDIPDTGDHGEAFYELPNTNAALVVSVVGNPQNPRISQAGYILPTFIGAMQENTSTLLVWRGGNPHIGRWSARVVLDTQ